MKIKNMMIVLMMLLVGVLAACTNSQADTSKEVETTTAVDQASYIVESKISPEFNDELNRFVEGVTEYSNKDKFHRDRYKSLAPTADKTGTLTKYKDFLDDFDIYLESYYFTPKNDVEAELTKHMRNYIIHMKSRNSFQKKFTETQDSMYDKLAMEEADETIIAIESLYNAMEKHEIIKE